MEMSLNALCNDMLMLIILNCYMQHTSTVAAGNAFVKLTKALQNRTMHAQPCCL